MATAGARVFSFDATFGLPATAGSIGAGAVLVLSAQPLLCELYEMENYRKNKNNRLLIDEVDPVDAAARDRGQREQELKHIKIQRGEEVALETGFWNLVIV